MKDMIHRRLVNPIITHSPPQDLSVVEKALPPGLHLRRFRQAFHTQYCAQLEHRTGQRASRQGPQFHHYCFIPKGSFEDAHVMAYSFLQGAEANRETPDSKRLVSSLRLTHFPQNPLFTDRFPPLWKSPKQSHSLSCHADVQGSGTEQGLSRAFHLFPFSGFPVGSG